MAGTEQMKYLAVLSVVLGCVSLLLVCTSIGTECWVVGSGPMINASSQFSIEVYFGLFQGNQYIRVSKGAMPYSLKCKWQRSIFNMRRVDSKLDTS